MDENYVQVDYKNEKIDLPKMLRYKTIKPKGLPTRQRRIEVNQMSNQSSYSFNDIIRFQFQTDSFIDPYQSYIELQVNVPQTEENMPKVTQKDVIVGYSDTTSTALYRTEKNKLPDFSSVPLYLLDGPATSFISEMIIYSNGREVERVQEYDQLGMLIHDLGISKDQKYKGGYYGLASQFGKSDYSYLSQQINNQGRSSEVPQQAVYGFSFTALDNSNEQELLTNFIQNGYSISRSEGSDTNDLFSINSRQYAGDATDQYLYVYQPYFYKSPVTDYLDINIVSQTQPPFLTSVSTTGLICNTVFNQTSNYNTQIQQYNKYPGIFNTTQYNQYIDYLNGQFNLNQDGYLRSQSCTPDQFINYAREFALQDGQYGIEHFDCISTTPFYQALNTSNYVISRNGTVLTGDRVKDPAFQPPSFRQANVSTDKIDFSQNLSLKRRKKILYNAASNMNNFTYFCPGIAQARWKDGKPVTSYNIGGASIDVDGSNNALNLKEKSLAMTKKTFYIPLLSGILGHLLPEDQWKLIPGKGCGLLNFEFRLNRFAMFMSGHKHNTTTTSGANPVAEDVTYDKQFHNGKQGWTVTKMSLHFQLWDFPSTVDDYISQQLESGIIMNSQAFVNGPTYSIQNTSSLKGNWQVNTAVQSLKKMYFWFLLDDYAKYNFCRKQFRISHNLKSLQLKAGAEFLPEQPITGHAGNLFEFNDETTKDVTPFFTELLRSHGEMFSSGGKINITPQNFIVNERAFQPNVHYQSQFQTAFLHETRLVGKAVYSIDLEADPWDFNTLTGKNVAQTRPFEIVIDTHAANGQTRPSTMFTLLHSDMLVSFTRDGIQIAI